MSILAVSTKEKENIRICFPKQKACVLPCQDDFSFHFAENVTGILIGTIDHV
jgi:hypothetical protein